MFADFITELCVVFWGMVAALSLGKALTRYFE